MCRRWLKLTVIMAMVLWGIIPLDAQARSRRRGPSAAQTKAMKAKMAAAITAQVNYEKQNLAQAQAMAGSAQREITDANSKLETARESLASSRTEQRSAVTELDDVEDQIIDDAGESSPIATAAAEYDTAEDAMQHAEHRVLNSPEYRQQLEALEPGPTRVAKVAEPCSGARERQSLSRGRRPIPKGQDRIQPLAGGSDLQRSQVDRRL